MKFQFINKGIVCLLVMALFFSCKKYLDEKSNQQLATPDTLEDLQALLDNEFIFRYAIGANQTGSDEYYVPFNTWDSRLPYQKDAYNWKADFDDDIDWTTQYELVLIANTVLNRVDEIATGTKADEIKGAALFLRAHCFFQLASLYAPQYDPASAATDQGIVLRLEPDFNLVSERASVKQTYDRIVLDLEQAVTILPTASPVNTRPNKAAGFGLLARVYLQIGEYEKARTAATESLSLYGQLIDYNDPEEITTASPTDAIRKPGIQNKEILFIQIEQRSLIRNSQGRIDPNLYALYESDDIRKAAFFRPAGAAFRFRASYVGSTMGSFTGLCTPEVYLIRAEANARLGNKQAALDDLTTLLTKRYVTGTVPTLTASTPEEALQKVLVERRKEMLTRGMRWADLKRLNKNPTTTVTLVRDFGNGTVFTLPPNDPKYVLLIPRVVMQQTNLEQNPR